MGVATAIAITSAAVTLGGAANSFVQAGKQKKAQREAESKAAQAMDEAKKKLAVNFAKNLSFQKEPYELAAQNMLSLGAMATQAGVESDRGAEVTAGKVYMAQNEGQAGIRSAMGQELTDINKQIINEDSRLRDLGVQLDLEEVAGQQLAARDAEEARSAAITEGFQGVSSALSQGLDMVPLFQKSASAKQASKMQKKSGTDQAGFQKATATMANEKGFSGLAGVGGMDANAFNATMSGYTKEQLKELDLLMKQKAKGAALKYAQGGFGFQ
jgi:hypothetical protein